MANDFMDDGNCMRSVYWNCGMSADRICRSLHLRVRHTPGRYFVVAVAAMDALMWYSSYKPTPLDDSGFYVSQSVSPVTHHTFSWAGLPFVHFPVAQLVHFVSKKVKRQFI